jgi:hypothetical protein
MLLNHTAYKIPTGLSLLIVAGIILISIALSTFTARKEGDKTT